MQHTQDLQDSTSSQYLGFNCATFTHLQAAGGSLLPGINDLPFANYNPSSTVTAPFPASRTFQMPCPPLSPSLISQVTLIPMNWS